MKNKIRNNLSSIISIFLLMLPIIDLLTGVSIHIFNTAMTFGIILKILFLIFLMWATVFIYKRKKVMIYYLFFILYLILYLVGIYLYKDGVGVLLETKELIKVFYFPLVLVSLYSIKDEIIISKRTLFSILSLYLIFIFIPTIFGLGYKTYEITKVGTLGFFNSANEISGIISLLTPMIFIVFSSRKNILLKVLFTLIYLFLIVTVGTKTPLLSLGITIVAVFIYLWIKWIKNKKYGFVFLSFLCLIVGMILFIMVVPKTNFYKNIKTHMDYLEVDSIGDVLKNEKLVDHFIFSQRLTFLKEKSKIYYHANGYQKLFGIGYMKNNKMIKMVEMDYFDIYYDHGIIGFLVFFIGYIYILIKVFSEKKRFHYEFYMKVVSFLLILILSLMTGHIITAPSVSLISTIIILNLEEKKDKDCLKNSFDL